MIEVTQNKLYNGNRTSLISREAMSAPTKKNQPLPTPRRLCAPTLPPLLATPLPLLYCPRRNYY